MGGDWWTRVGAPAGGHLGATAAPVSLRQRAFGPGAGDRGGGGGVEEKKMLGDVGDGQGRGG